MLEPYVEFTVGPVDATIRESRTVGALPTVSRPVKDCPECGGLGLVGSAHGARYGAINPCPRGCPA